jgi:hypothetical protein
MAHATIGFCFEGTLENGGEGLFINLNRCQAFKVAQKAYHGKGGVKVVKGDCLLTDWNVTGTDVGTPDKPKFAFRALWEYGLLPSLDALVGPGTQCEGALVIHQEDNAGRVLPTLLPFTLFLLCRTLLTFPVDLTLTQGPHKEGGFHSWLTEQFHTRGWLLELQVPQGPYTNVLDLQVFPAMSRRHSELLQVFSNTEADKERIWQIANEIWKTMTSSMAARAFILAFRIMGRIIETNGDTDWLKNGAPHYNVRRDYVDTDTSRGIKKFDAVVGVDDDGPEASQCY